MYGHFIRAEEPVAAYNALHKGVVDIVGSNDPEGLLVHLAYPTETS
jgi:hypothetical protein